MYDRAVQDLIEACQWDTTDFLIISENVFDPFIYYSHIVPLIVSLIIGFFILYKNPKQLISRILFSVTIMFSLWVFFDLILWATDVPHYTMFFWSIVNLIEPFIYVALLYFVQVFITGQDTSPRSKIIAIAPLIPFVILIPTNFTLLGYDLSNCNREAIEGPLTHYAYGVEIFYMLWLLVFAMESFRRTKDKLFRKKIILVTIGAILFLLSFSSGNLIGSITDDWRVSQWGLFGMPIFLAFLSYLIVKYKAFDIKLISTQALAVMVSVLVGSQLFIVEAFGSFVLISITFIISVIGGIFLVRSVKEEITLRESLEVANKGQANLLHIVNHQIKGYLAKGRLIFSELRDDHDYGPMPESARPMLEEGFKSLSEGVDFVKNFLDEASINKGAYQYKMEELDFKHLVEEVSEQQKHLAEKKNLSFELHIDDGEYKITGDKAQLTQAVRNLIDNSIHYTPSGDVKVGLSMSGGKMLFSVKDTGVGISEELRPRLFTEGGRARDSLKININSTGFGLAFVKQVALAHKGRVWVDSEGEGKGSVFCVELPANS